MSKAFLVLSSFCLAFATGLPAFAADEAQASQKLFVNSDISFSTTTRLLAVGQFRSTDETAGRLTCFLEFPGADSTGEAKAVKISKGRELQIEETPSLIHKVSSESGWQTFLTFSQAGYSEFSGLFGGYDASISQQQYMTSIGATDNFPRYGFSVNGLSVRAYYSCSYGHVNGYGWLVVKPVTEFKDLMFPKKLSDKPAVEPTEL